MSIVRSSARSADDLTLVPRAHPRGAATCVARISLTEFRCYRSAVLDIDPRPVVLTGPNGAGKTNLLEAISMLAPGRGLRRARLDELDRWMPGQTPGRGPAWAVAARILVPAGSHDVGTGRDPTDETVRRVVRIDGRAARGQTALAGLLTVLWLTPAMDRLFNDRAGERRRFLDRLVYGLDPEHAERVSAYDHALRERAHLLRAERAPDPAWLDVLEAKMAEGGVAIAAARRILVQRLNAVMEDGPGIFPRARLGVSGATDEWLDTMPALAAEEKLAAALGTSRGHDREAGGALHGPHRADLSVVHAGKGLPAREASTGEQKALLVAIVLAQAAMLSQVRGRTPILLLDEVAAHLDARRREALFDVLLALGAQCWLAGTDEATFAELGSAAQFVRVRDAMLAPAPEGTSR